MSWSVFLRGSQNNSFMLNHSFCILNNDYCLKISQNHLYVDTRLSSNGKAYWYGIHLFFSMTKMKLLSIWIRRLFNLSSCFSILYYYVLMLLVSDMCYIPWVRSTIKTITIIHNQTLHSKASCIVIESFIVIIVILVFTFSKEKRYEHLYVFVFCIELQLAFLFHFTAVRCNIYRSMILLYGIIDITCKDFYKIYFCY